MALRYLGGESLYSRTPDFYEPGGHYYYIHLHQENIGRMNNRDPLDDQGISNEFSSYKDGKDSILSKTITNQYVNMIKKSINRTSENFDLLNNVFDVENNNVNSLLDRLHQVLQKGFEEQFTSNKIISMLNIESQTNWSVSKKKNSNTKNIQALERMLQGEKANKKEGFAFLDAVLDGMAQAVELLNSPEGETLGAIIASCKHSYNQNQGVSQMGAALTKRINNFIKTHNGKTLNGRDAIDTANLLLPIASALKTGKTSQNKNLSLQSLQGLVQKNFYSLFAEILVSQLNEAANNAVVKYVVSSIQDVKNTGGDLVSIDFTDPEGNLVAESAQLFNDAGVEKQGKADIKFNNVNVQIESLLGEEQGDLNMKIGISNKAYVTNDFGEGSLRKFNVYSVGGGMTLGNAFTLLLGGNEVYKKYLGYNVFARGDSLPTALNTLQDVLLTRSIVYLVAGRGQKDFSQFMMLNGELLSVWDIIKFALGNDIGRSSSQIPSSSQSNGIYLSIEQRKSFMKYAKSRFWARRVIKTCDSINHATMKVHIVPKQIIAFAEKNTPLLTK